MLIQLKTGEELPDLWNNNRRYAEMLAAKNPSVYAIGKETTKETKPPAKPEAEKEVEEKEAPAPKNRGRRPSAKK